MKELKRFLRRYSWIFMAVGSGVLIWSILSETPIPTPFIIISVISMLIGLIAFKIDDTNKDHREDNNA